MPLPNGEECPNTAQFAVRQGALIARNIERRDAGKPPQPLRFRSLGELASIGRRVAVAEILGLRFSGFPAWVLWRLIYLSKLPRFDRKVRVSLDWLLDLFFPRDINLFDPYYSRQRDSSDCKTHGHSN